MSSDYYIEIIIKLFKNGSKENGDTLALRISWSGSLRVAK
jgi:hypothetical protein